MYIWFLGNIGISSCEFGCVFCCSCDSGIISCCVSSFTSCWCVWGIILVYGGVVVLVWYLISCCVSCCMFCCCVWGMIVGVLRSCGVGVTSDMCFRWSVGTGILDFCICGVAWFTGTRVWSGQSLVLVSVLLGLSLDFHHGRFVSICQSSRYVLVCAEWVWYIDTVLFLWCSICWNFLITWNF